MSKAQPKFKDIADIISALPDYAPYHHDKREPIACLSGWLDHFKGQFDMSKGFQLNRCALYWAGYDAMDGFDGQAFVESCQDGKGSLNQLASMLDTDLQIFELQPENHAPKSEDDLALAASYGMMAIEEGTQLFAACAFGQGVEGAAKDALEALSSSVNFTSSPPPSRDSLKQTPAQDGGNEWFESFMTQHCGLDHAAMLGAAIAGSLKGMPIILEGQSGLLVKALLEKTSGRVYDNIICTEALSLKNIHSNPAYQMLTIAILMKTLHFQAEL
jgi:hypothetical protein